MCVDTLRLSTILSLGCGWKLENCRESFWLLSIQTFFEMGWGQADLLYIDLYTRSIRMIIEYFIFLVRKT